MTMSRIFTIGGGKSALHMDHDENIENLNILLEEGAKIKIFYLMAGRVFMLQRPGAGLKT